MIVRENRHGEIAIEYKGKPLTYTVYREQAKQAEVVASKQIALKLDCLNEPRRTKDTRKAHTPSLDHPSRRYRVSTKPTQPSPAEDSST